MHFEIITGEADPSVFSKRGKNDYSVDGRGRGEADLWR